MSVRRLIHFWSNSLMVRRYIPFGGVICTYGNCIVVRFS